MSRQLNGTLLRLAAWLLVLAGAACAGADDAKRDPQDGASAGAQQHAARDGGAPDAGSTAEHDAIPELNGCLAADYEDRSADDDERVIEIASMGLTYSPKCMTIAVGQRVRWQGNLSAHPLAPGNPDDLKAGSAGTPIEATASGSEVAFVFDQPGTFPYHCTLHSFAAGRGMAGVVHVR